HRYHVPQALHSLPTRRSSDLVRQGADQAVASMSESSERATTTLLLAEAAGQALKEITNAISQISERNLVIASASEEQAQVAREVDRKSTRLNSSHVKISYAVF